MWWREEWGAKGADSILKALITARCSRYQGKRMTSMHHLMFGADPFYHRRKTTNIVPSTKVVSIRTTLQRRYRCLLPTKHSPIQTLMPGQLGQHRRVHRNVHSCVEHEAIPACQLAVSLFWELFYSIGTRQKRRSKENRASQTLCLCISRSKMLDVRVRYMHALHLAWL